MYVGRHHRATIAVCKTTRFECGSCGYATDVTVEGVGEGWGGSHYFLDEKGAADRASSAANQRAHENVELTAKLARCPVCGWRDRALIGQLRAKAVALGIVWLLVCLAIGWI